MQLTPPSGTFTSDDVLNHFLDYLIDSEIEMYDHQEEAVLELFAGNNVILNTPTGSGKSLVALALHCLLYTSPSPRDATLSRIPSSA